MFEAVSEPNSLLVGDAYDFLAGINLKESNYDSAIINFLKAIEIFKLNKSNNNLRLANCYTGLGILFRKTNNLVKALEYQKLALTKIEESNKSNSLKIQVYNNLGTLYLDLEEISKAKYYLEESISMNESSINIDQSTLGNSYNSLAMVYVLTEEYKKALNAVSNALNIFQNDQEMSLESFQLEVDLMKVKIALEQKILEEEKK